MAADKGVEAMMRHHAILYRDLADPVAFLRGVNRPTELQRYWAYVRDGDPALAAPAEIADYSALMAATQSFIAETVLDAIDLRGVATLLDVAGGEGAFLTAAAARHRQLQLMLFDLPPVAERAERRFTESGFETRARTFGGSFLRDPLPQGAGAATLVRVLHDHDDAPAMTILKRIRAALPAGARLWIAEPMAGVRGAETAGDTYFGFYLKAMGSGRPRTPAEIIAMAKEAGFAHAKTVATAHPVFVSIVAATA
jgi:demethylspheroidene O-methyltransferase